MDEVLLAEQYRSRILYFVLRQVRDRTAAEEITQDVLLIVLRAMREQRIRETSTPGPFIFGVAKNLILKYQSRQKREIGVPVNAELNSISWTTHPEAELLLRERKAEMSRAVDQLSDQDRDILYHAFVETDDLDAIARKLGISNATARKRKSRALDHLRRMIVALSQKKGS